MDGGKRLTELQVPKLIRVESRAAALLSRRNRKKAGWAKIIGGNVHSDNAPTITIIEKGMAFSNLRTPWTGRIRSTDRQRYRGRLLCAECTCSHATKSMTVDNLVAEKASNFNKVQQSSTARPQLLQQESRFDSTFAESRTVPSSRVTGCSPSSLYAFLDLPRLGSVLP